MEDQPVKFVPFSSSVDSPFWVEYSNLKLEDIQLSEDAIPMQAQVLPTMARLQCVGGGGSNSLTNQVKGITAAKTKSAVDKLVFHGNLLGFNTLDTFSKVDKNALLKEHFLKGFLSSDDDAVRKTLTSFVLLTFPDLKQHKVLYWFGIPALMTKTKLVAQRLTSFTPEQDLQLEQAFHNFRKEQESELPPFFVYSQAKEDIVLLPLSKDSVQDYNTEELVFGFVDADRSSTDDSAAEQLPPMGWTLRNLLAYLSIHLNLGGTTITIVSFRPSRLHRLQDDTIPSSSSSSTPPHSIASDCSPKGGIFL